MNFNEDFLHFVWKYRLLKSQNISTVSGDVIEVINPGLSNTNAGADFENAKIRIGETIIAGNVEIHIHSSDWNKHQHQTDEAYNNVILHVVYLNDTAVLRQDGTPMLTLELKNWILPDLESKYVSLMQNLNWIPCEKLLPDFPELHLNNWLQRVLFERLEEKSSLVNQLLQEMKGSWDDTFYVLLARNFGFKTNALPFEMLARSLPQQLLAKHKNNAFQIEALIFGQSGFLSNAQETYPKLLEVEYLFLQKKFKLEPLPAYLWKFLRLRPQNFPTLRLAQFAALVVKSNHLFSKLIEKNSVHEILALFKDLPINQYWQTHYRFGKTVEKAQCNLGTEAIENIILNTVAVTIFSYGKSIGDEKLIDNAIHLLENISAETNHIIDRFMAIGIKPVNAFRSQALLQLKKNYCDQKKCLNCAVGAKLLKLT